MINQALLIIIVQYVLLVSLFLISSLDKEKYPILINKFINSVNAILIGCMMIFIDLFNDFHSVFPIFTLSIRLYLVVFISLFPAKFNYTFFLVSIIITRFLIYDNIERNLTIYGILFLLTIISALINKIKISKLTKWYLMIHIIGFFMTLHLVLSNTRFIYIVHYTIFTFSFIIITGFINRIRIKRINQDKLWLNHNNIDFENYIRNIKTNGSTLKFILIELENLNSLKAFVSFKEYNLKKREISNLIKSQLRSEAQIFELKHDAFCVIMNDLSCDFNTLSKEICLELNDFKVKSNYKIMSEQDFIYYYNPQYQFSCE